MTIEELCSLFVEPDTQEIELWSLSENRKIWNGYADECISEYEDLEVISIDNLGGIDENGDIKTTFVINVG